MTRIAQKVYHEGIAEGKQESILTYLESRFGLGSVDIQNKIKSISEIDVLNLLIAKLYKAETEKQAVKLIDQALQNVG